MLRHELHKGDVQQHAGRCGIGQALRAGRAQGGPLWAAVAYVHGRQQTWQHAGRGATLAELCALSSAQDRGARGSLWHSRVRMQPMLQVCT